MSTMLQDYDHLLNIDPLSQYDILTTNPESHLNALGRCKESLNGRWHFTVDVYDTFLRKKFFEERVTDAQGRALPVDCDFDQWETVEVPSNWNCQKKEYWYFEGSGIYTRTFHYVPKAPDERVILHLGAANYGCRVWLNTRLIGRHTGGFTPFSVELTQHLKPNAGNRLILEVNNTRSVDQVPSLNYDWFNYGGVFRSVDLYRVPACYIRDSYIALAPNNRYDTLAVEITVDGAGSGIPVWLEIPELSLSVMLHTDAFGVAKSELTAKPQLWSPQNPKLYRVMVSTEGDRIEELVGFRQITTLGKKILLNGQEIFLKGVCCHEEIPERGRALTPADQRQVILQAKELGCNIMRLSHYPHDRNMALLADEMGMLLWEEIPVYWALCFENPTTQASAQNQMTELVMRDRNRASVVLWGVGNENPDTEARLDFMRALVDICKRLDPTRLTTAACLVDIDVMTVRDRLCQYIDVVAINEYYGWYYRDYTGLATILENTKLDRPLVISETGADALSGHHGMDEELFTEEHQAKMYQKQLELSEGSIQGFFPWILYDFRSPIRLNSYQQGFNRKGLISYDKTHRKLAHRVIQDYSCSVKN
ncbi:glycoside hydrolase family 2 TIM barrel-domain containing protein [Sphaerochaeta sp.]|jgi:beta-glucuronidase|uniref:glycoside hydrolase family 2 protein n=1 Tax=Sphaerochaeta sp. TaxID=1972642 RepID=UPI002585F567|nr:glycoside hydrolase family 2 TIM barrel-domain containing protein [Sphaerochaeta sp.]MDD3456448.1 glycoside hydrolase family 2 TIM barrel-domain containing protein [Sphaerochaeta sp.]